MLSFSSTLKTLITTISLSGIVAGGGYSAVNLLGRERGIDYASFDMDDTSKKVNQKITFAEYITRDHVSNGKINGICKEWRNGKVVRLEQLECEKKIKDKWNDSSEKQPEVWFRADEKNIFEALKEHFSSSKNFEEGQPIREEWKEGGLTCKKKTEPSNEGKIEVNCSFEETKPFVSN
ncbi:hypothetical protein [Mycoplasma suis]|uniref:Uncharacterized protein n=1 Tax=Mycoplasma suis (strain Illinois) TaxID=768700 RepID=F0QQJ0_MYCSL|nr:hypothetical protein [Mycoplasma suis]ADX97760.1 hypothetical protein MSU_0216 [Mycoplasma suis str. Illinois]